ncbi:MAG: GntR family transcriptional regulator [Desulforhopalus sp.]
MERYRTMTNMATEMLREKLLVGDLAPGTRLIPAELEETLNLGRMAIREALKELTGSGLVIQQANKGMCVAPPPSISELHALFDARCALEGKTAAVAAANIGEAGIADLEKLYEEMAVEGRKPIEYFLVNRKFHLLLYQISGWKHAVVCITHMLDQVLSYFGPYASRIHLDFAEFNKEHRLILDAINEKKLDEVHELTVANINHGRNFMCSLEKIPDK